MRLADVPARRVSRASPHPRSQVTRKCESSRPLAACARKEMEDGDRVTVWLKECLLEANRGMPLQNGKLVAAAELPAPT